MTETTTINEPRTISDFAKGILAGFPNAVRTGGDSLTLAQVIADDETQATLLLRHEGFLDMYVEGRWISEGSPKFKRFYDRYFATLAVKASDASATPATATTASKDDSMQEIAYQFGRFMAEVGHGLTPDDKTEAGEAFNAFWSALTALRSRSESAEIKIGDPAITTADVAGAKAGTIAEVIGYYPKSNEYLLRLLVETTLVSPAEIRRASAGEVIEAYTVARERFNALKAKRSPRRFYARDCNRLARECERLARLARL